MLFNGDEATNPDAPFERLTVAFKDESRRFCFKAENDYSKQFAHIYAARLGHMRALLEAKAKDKWGTHQFTVSYGFMFYTLCIAGDKFPLKKMFELKEDFTEKCILIGTLFKHQVC